MLASLSHFLNSWSGFANKFYEGSARYVGYAVAALLISLLLTPVFRELARKIGMVDKPDPRRINKVPIPRGGGLSIVLSVNIVLWLSVLANDSRAVSSAIDNHLLVIFTACSALLAVVGFIDDKRGLPAPIKLGGQLVVALVFFYNGIRWGNIIDGIPKWLDCGFTVFWIVGAINAFNLIDGLDGLASGLALIASLGLTISLISRNLISETIPFLALGGACLGFLRYNFNPASVFLGDTGSMFLGMTISTLPLLTGSSQELAVSLGMPLLVMGVPIFDTFLAIWRRSVRALLPNAHRGEIPNQGGGAVMQPDKDHLHHRLLRLLSNNQRKAALVLYSISLLFVSLGLGMSFLKGRATGLFMIAFIALGSVVVRYFNCVEIWDTGQLMRPKKRLLRKSLAMPISITIDTAILLACWMFTFFFVYNSIPTRQLLLKTMPFMVVPVLVAMVIGRIHERVWSRSRLLDFIILGMTVFAGCAVGTGIIWLMHNHRASLIRFVTLFATTSYLLLSAVRCWREFVSGLVNILEPAVFRDKKAGAKRILVLGGGLTLRSFIREKIERETRHHRLVVGIVDDNPLLRGRMVSGYEVLGDSNDLEDLVKEHHIDALVITCDIKPEERFQEIVDRMKVLDLPVSVWITEEQKL